MLSTRYPAGLECKPVGPASLVGAKTLLRNFLAGKVQLCLEYKFVRGELALSYLVFKTYGSF